jgi:hypothetical protein
VAFPAVMVSTDMQGGCICENCSYLRIGINNIALTAPFAPRPLAMSGADDWTINIETSGLPELRRIWDLYGKPDFVHAKTYRQFGHNYNQVSREMMYAWFNRHLALGHSEPIEEREFVPVPPRELSVFDEEHPRPSDAAEAQTLREYFTSVFEKQFAELLPRDANGLAEYQRVIGTVLRVMFDGALPGKEGVAGASRLQESTLDGYRLFKVSTTRKDAGEQVPVVSLFPPNFNGSVVIWVDGQGKGRLFGDDGRPAPAVKRLLDSGRGVIMPDVFLTGEFLGDGEAPAVAVDERFPGYTFAYNRPLLANRVRDILTVLGGLEHFPQLKTVHFVGTGDAGPWVLLARALAGERVSRCVVDLRGFGFSKVTSRNDPMLLPGGLKYGGIGGLAAAAAPAALVVAGAGDAPEGELAALKAVYQAAGGSLTLHHDPLTDLQAVDAILK